MNKIIKIILTTSIFSAVLVAPILAQTTSTSTAQELIQSLQKQIEALKTQVNTLNAQLAAITETQSEVKETAKDIKGTLRLINQLKPGMTSEEVKLLQEILATDPDIYPQGHITGYYGKLTEKAVKRFQKIAGIEQVGLLGPKTLSKINELLEEGAGNSGKVPPGLLIAPGIRKKLGYTPIPKECEGLPPGVAKKIQKCKDLDLVEPVISNVTATGTSASSTKITWTTNEKADSAVWYGTSTPLVISSTTEHTAIAELVTSHTVTLDNLKNNTTYYYIVSSSDQSGNTATSSQNSFVTLTVVQDNTPPQITNLIATSTQATSTRITWTTDEAANSKLWYSTSTPLVIGTLAPNVSSSSLALSHDLTATGLTASTTYYYLVTSADSSGNTATSTQQSFVTLSQ